MDSADLRRRSSLVRIRAARLIAGAGLLLLACGADAQELVRAFGDADNMHAHTIVVEDGGEGPAGELRLRGGSGSEARAVHLEAARDGPRLLQDRARRRGLEGAVPGTATSYEDRMATLGLHDYRITPAGRDKSATCTIDLCPSDLACSWGGAGVRLAWRSPLRPSGHRILRDGAEIGSAPGEASSFTDAEAPCGRHRYEVRALPAGCAPLSCEVLFLCRETCYAEPQGGSDYAYDPKPGDRREWVVQYEPFDQTPGCLDGEWERSKGSARPDESAPGEVDEDDPNGLAPGGLGLLEA